MSDQPTPPAEGTPCHLCGKPATHFIGYQSIDTAHDRVEIYAEPVCDSCDGPNPLDPDAWEWLDPNECEEWDQDEEAAELEDWLGDEDEAEWDESGEW